MTAFGARFESSDEDPARILDAAFERFGEGLHFACGFTLEDVVLLDLAVQGGHLPRAFFVDTGRHFEETYQAADAVRSALGVEVRWVFPNRAELSAQLSTDGATNITSDPVARRRCCDVRRIQPTRLALARATAWVTGARRDQADVRTGLEVVSDGPQTHSLPRIAPLAACTWREVVTYAQRRQLPIHALYRRGYTSIGCAPCTRSVSRGEPERAGRWPFEAASTREEGEHISGEWSL